VAFDAALLTEGQASTAGAVTASTWIASVVIGGPKSDRVLAVQKTWMPAWVRSRVSPEPIDVVCSG
jgi:hypothetical protein